MRKTLAGAALALSLAASPFAAHAANLVETLKGKKEYSTFLKALEASDAKWFVREDVEYTAFVPTNAAFDALPEGVLDALLKPENRPKLDATLERHVVPDLKVEAGGFGEHPTLDVAEGESLDVKLDGSTIIVEGATVTDADIAVDQGFAHGIDKVLVPELVVQAMKYTGEYPKD